MIETLLALQIIYGTPKAINKICDAVACTFIETHQIYIDRTQKDKEFILYHEIGHNLYWDGKDANNSSFSEQQDISDDFAWYMMSKLYPNKYIDSEKYWTYKTFYNKYTSVEEDELFKKTCDSDCVKLVKNMI